MKRIINCLIILLILSTGVNIFANSDSFILGKMNVIIQYGSKILNFTDQDGNELPVLSYNDVTYVPLRSYSEQLDKNVDYSQGKYEDEIVISNNSHFGTEYGKRNSESESVSLIDLIARPDAYNGKSVSVSGILNIGFEDNYLFLTENDWKYFNTNNAIALGVQADEALLIDIRELENLSGQYVNIEGIFQAYTDNPTNAADGLRDINFIEVMGD